MSMKILKILSGNDGGGVFTCEKQFIKSWKNEGITVDAIITGNGSAQHSYKKLVNNSILLPEIKDDSNEFKSFKFLKYLIKSKYHQKNNHMLLKGLCDYDAIVYRRYFFKYLALTVSEQSLCKIYWHLPQSVETLPKKLIYKHLINNTGIIPVGNSKYTMNSLGSICKHFVYPGYDIDRLNIKSVNNLRDSLGIDTDSIVFGVAARINKRKAQHLVIQAFIKLLESYPNTHLLIAGGSLNTKYSKFCFELAKDYKRNIHFTGQIKDMGSFYSSIDIYVNSRIDAEPFGISVAEAMGAGLPVIAYKIGGPSEMIQNHINGWLIERPNVDDYYKVFNEAMNKSSNWEKMGEISKINSSKFSADHNAKKFINIIKNDLIRIKV